MNLIHKFIYSRVDHSVIIKLSFRNFLHFLDLFDVARQYRTTTRYEIRTTPWDELSIHDISSQGK